jgi:Domain of unknown function (DUF3303)
MLPESVTYQASWIDAQKFRSFRLMEAPDRELLERWIAAWADLGYFEVVPVQTSAEFWAINDVVVYCRPKASEVEGH